MRLVFDRFVRKTAMLILFLMLFSMFPSVLGQYNSGLFPQQPYVFQVLDGQGSLQIEYAIVGADLIYVLDRDYSEQTVGNNKVRRLVGVPSGNELKVSVRVVAKGVIDPQVSAYLNTGISDGKIFEDIMYSPQPQGYTQPIDWERSFELSMAYDTTGGRSRYGFFSVQFAGGLDGFLYLEVEVNEVQETQGPDYLQITPERFWLDEENNILFVEGTVASKSEITYNVFYRTDPSPVQGYITISDEKSFGAQAEFSRLRTNIFEIVMENKGKVRDMWVLKFDGDGTLLSSKRLDTSSANGSTTSGSQGPGLINLDDPLQATLILTAIIAAIIAVIMSGVLSSAVAIFLGAKAWVLSIALKMWSLLPGSWYCKIAQIIFRPVMSELNLGPIIKGVAEKWMDPPPPEPIPADPEWEYTPSRRRRLEP